MSEWAVVTLVLLAFYLLGCTVWATPGTVLLRSQAGEPPRILRLRPGAALGRGEGGLLIAHLPPTGESWVCRGEALDAEAAGERIRNLRSETRFLKPACGLLFAYVFLALPALVLLRAPMGWPGLLLGGLLPLAAVWTSFFLAHRALHPQRGRERLKLLAGMLLSPADAMHAADALTRKALEGFHPLAAAKPLCGEDVFRDFARRTLRQARHALPGPERARWLERVEDFVRSQGVDPVKLLEPPQPKDAGCRSFCPRCEQQYVLEQGACADCGAVALEPLRPPGPPTGPAP